MSDKIREQIARLRFHSTHALGVSDLDPPYIHEVFGRAADSLEALLEVAEAAEDLYDEIDGEGIVFGDSVRKLGEALAKLED